MAHRRTTALATLLALLVYLGQSLAVAAAPCLPVAAPASHAAGAGHSGHDSATGGAADNCCEGGGFCSMSHCLSGAALPVSPPPTVLPLAGCLPVAAGPAVAASRHESIFRPPIAR